MPGNRKTPSTNINKRTTASAMVRISTKRVKKTVLNADRSFIQDQVEATVRTATQPCTSNETIITFLQKLDESIKILSSRMDRMEQRSWFNSTPVISRLHSHESHHPVTSLPYDDFKCESNLQDHPAGPSNVAHFPIHTATHQASTLTDMNRPGTIVSSLDVVSWIPLLANSVNNILSEYE